ncbi:MAG TPA: hypothetical protein VMA73_30015 [Streptosporangiaceae bacterium]|nr:hypothetical protein [Streptosporangiaceae bacterium]
MARLAHQLRGQVGSVSVTHDAEGAVGAAFDAVDVMGEAGATSGRLPAVPAGI